MNNVKFRNFIPNKKIFKLHIFKEKKKGGLIFEFQRVRLEAKVSPNLSKNQADLRIRSTQY